MRGSTSPPIAAVSIVSILFVAMIGLSIWYLTRREPLVVQGEVQCRTFDMAARVDGRVAEIAVARSENVKQGTPIIRIDNPELLARHRQSEADLAVAEAELARVNAGFRAETIAVRKAQVDRAAADLTLAQQTYERKRQLAASHDAPMADLDKATAELAVAQRGLEQARFAYNEAVAGYTREDHGIAAVQGRDRQGRRGDAQVAGRSDGGAGAGRQPGVPHSDRGRRVRAARHSR